MKWPFLLRSVHEETVTDLRRRLDDSETERRKLVRTIVKMKVAGGTIPRALDGVRLEQRERNPFEKAVDENPRCKNNPLLRRHLLGWADREREKGVPEKEILDKLSSWHVVRVSDGDEDEDDELIAI